MIRDWDDAYNNGGHIEGGSEYPIKFAKEALAFRKGIIAAGQAELDIAYGAAEREKLDIFRPAGVIKGLAVFIHGGYWRAFDKSDWSHLAKGAVECGWAVCLPSYTLAPEARLSEITKQIARAIDYAADLIDGPIRLAGHSAGGHLVSRMACENSTLGTVALQRLEAVVSISGLHDLRPLLRTSMNDVLKLDLVEATAESAALLRPREDIDITCWVGSDERPEFIRQNDLLANIWSGLGASIKAIHAPNKHHFNVIEDLADANSALTSEFVGQA